MRLPSEHERDGSALLAGLVCGLTVGAVLGLLLAPKPGRESRAWIGNRSLQAGRQAKAFLNSSAIRDIIRRRGVLGLRDVWQQSRQWEHTQQPVEPASPQKFR